MRKKSKRGRYYMKGKQRRLPHAKKGKKKMHKQRKARKLGQLNIIRNGEMQTVTVFSDGSAAAPNGDKFQLNEGQFEGFKAMKGK